MAAQDRLLYPLFYFAKSFLGSTAQEIMADLHKMWKRASLFLRLNK